MTEGDQAVAALVPMLNEITTAYREDFARRGIRVLRQAYFPAAQQERYLHPRDLQQGAGESLITSESQVWNWVMTGAALLMAAVGDINVRSE
jgi:hypothetical protein